MASDNQAAVVPRPSVGEEIPTARAMAWGCSWPWSRAPCSGRRPRQTVGRDQRRGLRGLHLGSVFRIDALPCAAARPDEAIFRRSRLFKLSEEGDSIPAALRQAAIWTNNRDYPTRKVAAGVCKSGLQFVPNGFAGSQSPAASLTAPITTQRFSTMALAALSPTFQAARPTLWHSSCNTTCSPGCWTSDASIRA
jgi:hypothetical protein